ncbi:MAG: hypothetical protein LKF52_00870 [Butyrivibrio sp.]|jgi:hypothetical protein|nr:hypothetical protein [Butyrivibrio sp.]
MKKGLKYSMPTGTSSVLLIFMTLCLISFATLSFVNAKADLRLSQKLAVHTTDYYHAVNKAEAFVAASDALLQTVLSDASDSSDYLRRAEKLQLSADFSISDLQSLHVVLTPVYPQKKGDALYRIQSWQVITHEDKIQYDNRLNVAK